MADVKQLPTRDEVDPELTWDLTPIYQTTADFESDFKAVQDAIPELEQLRGTLAGGADNLLHAITAILAVIRRAEKVYVYASLKHDEDTGNAENQALSGRTQTLFTTLESAIAWFDPELLALDPDKLTAMITENPELANYKHYIDTITDQREHVLAPSEEKLLAQAGDALGAASNTFGVLNDADLEFPVVEDNDGQAVQLSQGVYDQLIQSTKPEVRQMAFKQLYAVYHQFAIRWLQHWRATLKRIILTLRCAIIQMRGRLR